MSGDASAARSDEAELLARALRERAAQVSALSPTAQPTTRRALATRLVDGRWDAAPDIGAFFAQRLEDGMTTRTRARVAYDDHALHVRVITPAPALRPCVQHFWMCDTVEIFIDPAHDHRGFLQVVLLPDAARHGFRGWRTMGTQRWEAEGASEPIDAAAWSGSSTIADGVWTARFVIPFAALGHRPMRGTPWGFQAMRVERDLPADRQLWNATHRGAIAPWAFGDLFFDELPRIAVLSADLGDLRLGANRARLVVRNRSRAAAAVRLGATLRAGASARAIVDASTVDARIAADADAAIEFAFACDRRDWKHHRLDLELGDASGRLWAGSFQLGYANGRMLHLDQPREGSDPAEPDPADPAFAAKKRAWVQRRLPRFVRRTTAQGAPSDFTLDADDGSVRFDLMRAGELRRIAGWLGARFATDLDRLLGAMLFIHQPAVITYAHAPSALAARMSPLSILRFGNARCASQNEALCGVVERMVCAATGRPYRARTATFARHVVAVVELGGKWAQLDASLGRCFFLPGTTELASLDELIARPELAEAESPAIAAMLRESQGTDLPYYGHVDDGVWPPGAPAE